MPLIYYYNQATLGQEYTNITASSVAVGNFVATGRISADDFRNASNTTITVQDANQQLSDYLTAAQGVQQFPGGPVGGEAAPYYLIVHPKTLINPPAPAETTYTYDGCRFQFYPSSNQSGHIMGYRHNTQTYDFQPLWSYVYAVPAGLSGNIGVERIKAVRWVALWDDSSNSVIALRPLYAISMAGTGWVGGDGSAYFYGSLVPISTAQAWFENIEQRIDPDDPNDNPDDGDEQDVTDPTGTFNWTNKFTIVNWGDNDPWPSKLMVDVPENTFYGGYWTNHYNDYFAWNDTNDTSGTYHTTLDLHAPYNLWYAGFHTLKDNIGSVHTLGSDLSKYIQLDSTYGRFITYVNPDTDPMTGTLTQFTTAPKKTFTIKPGSDSITYDCVEGQSTSPVSGITLTDNNNNTFNLSTNYPNFYLGGSIQGVNPSPNNFCAATILNIIRYRGHYYLGGVFNFCDSDGFCRSGFAVICRIDKLADMPNYGGSDPDDPGGATGPDGGLDPDNTFGDGNPGIGPNPSTDKDVDNNTGDGTQPIDPGLDGLGQPGYYDDDGNYHAPDGTTYGPDDPDNPRNQGTGEKQSNPVNTTVNVNIHDGSVGNGTGDPHQGDTEITNPSTTLPAGGTTGTIGGAGFLSIFTPTQAELTDFSGELFSTSALTAIKQYFSSNPMDGIFGLHMVPFTGFASNVIANPRIGTYDFTTTLTLAAEEFINVDYGEIDVPFVYDGYENFAPQSDARIFLPFIGTKDIDINIIQGCKIHLYYNVSLVTGDIYAYLYCQWNSKYQQAGVDQGVDHLMYHWQGNCAVNIPISHVDSSNYISGAMQIAGGITSLAAGAVAGSPFTIPSGITGVTQGIAEMGRSSIVTSGNISGVSAFMGAREPYLILSRPIIAFNNSYNHYLGRKSNAVCRIGVLEDGSYTQMRNIDLSGVTATNDELQQIEGILKGGFYV